MSTGTAADVMGGIRGRAAEGSTRAGDGDGAGAGARTAAGAAVGVGSGAETGIGVGNGWRTGTGVEVAATGTGTGVGEVSITVGAGAATGLSGPGRTIAEGGGVAGAGSTDRAVRFNPSPESGTASGRFVGALSFAGREGMAARADRWSAKSPTTTRKHALPPDRATGTTDTGDEALPFETARQTDASAQSTSI
ncbi:MAG: hypothetical protein ABIT01_03855 [Thermoanaerobaculia bacterium]